MPYDDPDPTDPMTLHGVVFAEAPSLDAIREMALCFIEEFAPLGFGEERILRMFRTPEYAGPFLAWQTLGEQAISQMIQEVVARRGGRRGDSPIFARRDGTIGLTVLDV